jgi:hypothetical protein
MIHTHIQIQTITPPHTHTYTYEKATNENIHKSTGSNKDTRKTWKSLYISLRLHTFMCTFVTCQTCTHTCIKTWTHSQTHTHTHTHYIKAQQQQKQQQEEEEEEQRQQQHNTHTHTHQIGESVVFATIFGTCLLLIGGVILWRVKPQPGDKLTRWRVMVGWGRYCYISVYTNAHEKKW